MLGCPVVWQSGQRIENGANCAAKPQATMNKGWRAGQPRAIPDCLHTLYYPSRKITTAWCVGTGFFRRPYFPLFVHILYLCSIIYGL